MTPIPTTLRNRWRSGRHVGNAKPAQIVEVQAGYMNRLYQTYEHLDGSKPKFGFIQGSDHNDRPWQAEWVPTGPWITVPNVASVDLGEQFDENGVADPEVATVVVENVVFKQVAGVGGIFHQIKRGYMAPLYGWRAPKRPTDSDANATNEWWNVLNGSYRIRITQGYGDSVVPVFIGLIDDTDTHSAPDQVTITARNFGVMLTDERVFGWNKAKEILSPVVFADRRQAHQTEHAGSNADASSTDPAHSYQNVLKFGSRQYWLSHGHDDPAHTEWVEIHLPKGRYSEFFLAPDYDEMNMYVSIFARSNGLGMSCKIDGVNVPDGWIDTGLGDVPGETYPFVKESKNISKGGQIRQLPFTLDCGDGTVLRISFRNLGFSAGKGDYRARVSRLLGYRQKVSIESLRIKHWVLVDDMADLVRWTLMWCGFHEWQVEDFGYSLKTPAVFHQGDFMIDIIRYATSQGNYVFYVDRPSSDPDSIGVPRFVQNRATAPPQQGIEEVRDTDLLTGVQTKFTKEPLAYIMRARGRFKKGGVPLGEDREPRVQAMYFPPWSGAHRNVTTDEYQPHYPFPSRMAGLRKHWVHFDDGIRNETEALMFCILAAIQMGLAAFQGTIEIPGHPGIRLNEQTSVIDTPSGMNTRIWVGSRHTTFTQGESTEYKVTLQGAMIDTPDMLALAYDYLAVLDMVKTEAG